MTVSAQPVGHGAVPIALVRPPAVALQNSFSGPGTVPPLGLAYIAATLRDVGYDVQVVDAVGEDPGRWIGIDSPVGRLQRIGLSPAEIAARIRPDARYVGMSLMFLHEWPTAREVVRAIKSAVPGATVIMGGETATSYASTILDECPEVDVCVVGEGEATIVELLHRLDRGLPLDDLPGIVRRDEDGPRVVTGGLPVRRRRLGEIPRPAWDLVPVERYLELRNSFGVDRGRSMPVLATRGCPYECTFCSSPQMWTTKYVVRDPEDVVSEIAELVDRYDLRNVDFSDLTAITRRRWTLEFCDALDRRGLDITWQLPVGTRAEALDREVLTRLFETGCRNITYAPESGSERMLGIFGKKLSLPHVLMSVREANRIGFKIHANLIIGHPEERWEDLFATFRLAIRLAVAGCDTLSAIMFAPYPGSVDYDRLLERGLVRAGDESCYVGLSRGASSHRSYNDSIGDRQLRAMQIGIEIAFFGVGFAMRPWRLVRAARSQVGGRETTHLEQLVRLKRMGRRTRRAQRTQAVFDVGSGPVTVGGTPPIDRSAAEAPERAMVR